MTVERDLRRRLYDIDHELAPIREAARARGEANASLAANELEKAAVHIGNAKFYLDKSADYLDE